MKKFIMGILIITLFTGCINNNKIEDINLINDFIFESYPNTTKILFTKDTGGYYVNWVNDSCVYQGFFKLSDGGFYWSQYPQKCETGEQVKRFNWHDRGKTE